MRKPRPYKATNKRIIQRGYGGKFRRSTLADIGMAECEKCHCLFAPDLSQFENDPMIDPRKFRDAIRLCPSCVKQAS